MIPAADTQPLDLQEAATQVAARYHIATTTLFNLIDQESGWNPNITSKDGNDRGLLQISRIYFPAVSDAEAYDPLFSLDFAAKEIAQGNAYLWTSCSCVKSARLLGLKFPFINSPADLSPNATPQVGGAVILKYGSVWHMAVITKLDTTGMQVIEGNFEPCKITRRTISYQDMHIVGFYVGMIK